MNPDFVENQKSTVLSLNELADSVDPHSLKVAAQAPMGVVMV